VTVPVWVGLPVVAGVAVWEAVRGGVPVELAVMVPVPVAVGEGVGVAVADIEGVIV
jgi:hypothetical protein